MYLSRIVYFVHIIILLTGIVIPFIGNTKQLEAFSFIIPVLFFHWALNDDTCFLTQVEGYLTDQPKERTFIGRIVGPIYNLSDDAAGKLIKTILFSLWIFVQFKLGRLFK
tara:strand:- start:309 stop:638 length:330 start_codon:yes stop_codon:yes gene_type:complete